MQIEIVTIGHEVLSGRTLDTNFAFLARALEEISVQVAWHSTVDDESGRIAEGLTNALDRADAVIMTGGLGPTPDDLTRKAVATTLGRPLQLDEAALGWIRDRAKRMARRLPAAIETMALVPRGAEVWRNPEGAAPGVLILHHDKPVVLLPGVPQEMEALAREFVVPYFRERVGHAVEVFTLRTFGIAESVLDGHIGNLSGGWPGATLAYLPSWFGVDLRVTIAGSNAAAVRETRLRAYEELRARVSNVVYAEGTTTMEEVVGAALVGKGWRIATAESCTGGLLAKRLTDVAGSSRYLERGFVTYSNEAKYDLLGVDRATLEAQGAVSAAVAEQMAAGARGRAGVEVGVGITGVAGPDGGSETKPVGTVFIAVASPLGAAVRLHRMVGTRATVRERSAQTALEMLRRNLLGLPVDAALE
ncbi:MAG: competence/damage-inducible protein A [Candidatus Eisenbacteria bacterium]|nr:competence/damage-inducible protein A [Candidatus Eisenbacteria bacterium]